MAAGQGRYLNHLYGDDVDARRFNRQIHGCLVLLYLHFGLVLLGWLPGWTMFLSAPVLVVRWMLSMHELFHLHTAREVDACTRLLCLMLTPFFLGYREMRDMHRGHHRHMATPQDPDFFHIRGNKFCGLFNAMTAPEQMTARWLRRHGADAPLLGHGAVRLAFGASYFAFFYCLHRRGNAYGVYAAQLPAWAAWLFGKVFGQDALLATLHHDIHHGAPRVRALDLPAARAAAPFNG